MREIRFAYKFQGIG